jgi:hypothetical protein
VAGVVGSNSSDKIYTSWEKMVEVERLIKGSSAQIFFFLLDVIVDTHVADDQNLWGRDYFGTHIHL